LGSIHCQQSIKISVVFDNVYILELDFLFS
jgi:hypothetical protein